jgi:MFS family permease
VTATPDTASLDRRALYATAFVRAMTTSLLGVELGIYLGRVGLTPGAIEAIIAAGLAGTAVAALLATFFAERIGRRGFLIGAALLGGAGIAAFSMLEEPAALAAAAFLGMLNGMGRDRGAALILEQAALPGTTSAAGRTRVIAIYTMLQDVGHALGALAAAVPAALAATGGGGDGGGAGGGGSIDMHRAMLLLCAVLTVVPAAFYLRLGAAFSPPPAPVRVRLTPQSRRILTRISALFAVDALAGGFLTTAMLSYFFFERFGASEATIAVLFFAARLMNALSHLGAAWLAKRIGLVNTMVFTHMPSSLLLVTVAFAPSFGVAAVFFLLREGLVEMDVPTRSSYVLAVVAPEERTIASGVTNLVRLAAWATAPALASLWLDDESLMVPLVIGAGMKIAYDILLYLAFRRVRPPEEQEPG